MMMEEEGGAEYAMPDEVSVGGSRRSYIGIQGSDDDDAPHADVGADDVFFAAVAKRGTAATLAHGSVNGSGGSGGGGGQKGGVAYASSIEAQRAREYSVTSEQSAEYEAYAEDETGNGGQLNTHTHTHTRLCRYPPVLFLTRGPRQGDLSSWYPIPVASHLYHLC